MTEPKTKYPLESFGPELLAALCKGSLERVVIPFLGAGGIGRRLAITFQRRIHTLRQRLRASGHPQYTLTTRAKVSVFWGHRAVEEGLVPAQDRAAWNNDHAGDLGAYVVIQPRDSEFTEILARAGISIARSPLSDSEYLDDILRDEKFDDKKDR